jgi:UDP-N-acetylglucosamine:LPS N-acetylglucosamine transferase
LTGQRLFEEIEKLRADPAAIRTMRTRVQQFAKPGAAERTADVLEQAASL